MCFDHGDNLIPRYVCKVDIPTRGARGNYLTFIGKTALYMYFVLDSSYSAFAIPAESKAPRGRCWTCWCIRYTPKHSVFIFLFINLFRRGACPGLQIDSTVLRRARSASTIVKINLPVFVLCTIHSPKAVFLEQMYRAIVGDRHYHSHNSQNEDTKLSTLSSLILDNSLVSSIPLDTFAATDTVASTTSSFNEFKEVFLADG